MDARRHTTSLEDEIIKEYVLVNLSSVISKVEVVRLLNIAKERFKSKKRVNKIMFGKIDEVTKETEVIMRQFLIDQRYDVNPTNDVTQSGEQSQDTSISKVHVVIPDKKKDQSFEKAISTEHTNVHTTVVDNSDEAVQDPPVIEIILEKTVKETYDVEKGEKDVSAEVVGKEKGEDKDYQALVIVARDTVVDKRKQVVTDSNDFAQGPIDLISLSLIQALKLATLHKLNPVKTYSSPIPQIKS